MFIKASPHLHLNQRVKRYKKEVNGYIRVYVFLKFIFFYKLYYQNSGVNSINICMPRTKNSRFFDKSKNFKTSEERRIQYRHNSFMTYTTVIRVS